MSQLFKFILLVGSMIVIALPVQAANENILQLKTDTSQVATSKELVQRATIIVYGRLDQPSQTMKTSKKIGKGHVYRYVQTMHVKHVLKGESVKTIKVLITGIEPSPQPTDSISLRYPGKLAEGNYICFLKQIVGTNYYTTVGNWQGVYPMSIDGRTINLSGEGFQDINGLTVDEMTIKINDIQKQNHLR